MKTEHLKTFRRTIDITEKEIKPHPRNPRRGKVSAIKDSIKVNGYYPTIFVQESTGYILKGNHTYKALKELVEAGLDKFREIEVNMIEVSDEEALRIILADNASSDLGSYSNEEVYDILDELNKTEKGFLGTLWETEEYDDLKFVLNKEPVIPAEAINAPTEEEAKERLAEGVSVESIGGENALPEESFLYVFPAEPDFDIPILDINMQVEKVELPFMVWSMQRTAKSLSRGEVATLAFYCEDVAFEGVWKKPNKIVEARVNNVVEVNFSTDSQAPKAFNLWQFYRKRWLSRYWQSKGIRIMVDVCINRSAWDLVFLGVPKGWRSYCNRGNVFVDAETARSHYLDMYELCKQHAETDDITYMIYGGGNVIKKLCSEMAWVWIPDEKMLTHGKNREDVRALEKAHLEGLTEGVAMS